LTRRAFVWGSAPAGFAFGGETVADDPAGLRAAVSKARPGDTILLRDGTWTDAELTIDAEGEAGRPITVRAQTPGKVVLTGRSRLRVGGRYVVVDGLFFKGGEDRDEVIAFRVSPSRLATECRITRCAVVDYKAESKEKNTKWVSIYGSKNRFDHCYLAGKLNLGTTLVVWLKEGAATAEHVIENNHFGPRPPLGVNGGETIRVGDSSTSMLPARVRVRNNYFEKCSGEVEIISNKSCENVYTGNLFERCGGTLTLRHGNRCTVDGNVFLGHGAKNTGGIRIIGEDHHVRNNYMGGLTGSGSRAGISMMSGIVNSPLFGYFQVKRAVVEGNTVVDCAESIDIGVGDLRKAPLPPEGCVFRRNVIVGRTGPLVRMLSPGATVEWDGNSFYGAPIGVDGLAAAKQEPVVHEPKIEVGDKGPDWFGKA
jgi:poly(beta-D-mannuronate) lyase